MAKPSKKWVELPAGRLKNLRMKAGRGQDSLALLLQREGVKPIPKAGDVIEWELLDRIPENAVPAACKVLGVSVRDMLTE